VWSVGFKAARQVYLSLRWAQVQNGHGGCQQIDGEGWADVLARCLPGQQPCLAERRRTTVWLSGALARPFQVAPVSGLTSREELMQVVRAQAAEATGLSDLCTVWLDGRWSPKTGGLAAAIETEVLAAVQEWARRHRTPLLAVRPWWNPPLNDRWRVGSMQAGRAELISLQDEEALMVFGQDAAGVLRCASTYWPLPGAEARVALMKRQGWSLTQEAAGGGAAGAGLPRVHQGVRLSDASTLQGPKALTRTHWFASGGTP
jgi:hypothetical protein